MLTGKYEIAEIKDDEKARKRLEIYENELAKELGGDIVLVAYQLDDRTKD